MDKEFIELYSKVSKVDVEHIKELMKIQTEKQKTEYSRVLTCKAIYEHQQNRIDELEQEFAVIDKENINSAIENYDLQAQLQYANEVIAFYANKANQIPPIYKHTSRPGAAFTAPYRLDSGKKAREYQTKYKGDKK